jgi:hypothetical protein
MISRRPYSFVPAPVPWQEPHASATSPHPLPPPGASAAAAPVTDEEIEQAQHEALNHVRERNEVLWDLQALQKPRRTDAIEWKGLLK